jgi:hypothetical protein
MNGFNRPICSDLILAVAFISLISAPAGILKTITMGLVVLLFSGSMIYRVRYFILYKKCPSSTCIHS